MSDYVNLGRSGLRVSRLGLGTFNFGHAVIGCDEATSAGIIHAYLDAGHNYIDTANIYGGSLAETYVGKAIKGRRDDVVLATKAGGAYGSGPFEGGASRKALYRALEDSLRRLETGYVDLYQVHVFDYHTPLEETLSTLNDMVRQGRIRHYGVCNWNASQITDAARLCQANGWEPIVTAVPQVVPELCPRSGLLALLQARALVIVRRCSTSRTRAGWGGGGLGRFRWCASSRSRWR